MIHDPDRHPEGIDGPVPDGPGAHRADVGPGDPDQRGGGAALAVCIVILVVLLVAGLTLLDLVGF